MWSGLGEPSPDGVVHTGRINVIVLFWRSVAESLKLLSWSHTNVWLDPPPPPASAQQPNMSHFSRYDSQMTHLAQVFQWLLHFLKTIHEIRPIVQTSKRWFLSQRCCNWVEIFIFFYILCPGLFFDNKSESLTLVWHADVSPVVFVPRLCWSNIPLRCLLLLHVIEWTRSTSKQY